MLLSRIEEAAPERRSEFRLIYLCVCMVNSGALSQPVEHFRLVV